MKKFVVLILTLTCLFGLIGCVKKTEENITPTGYPTGEIQQPQIMYNEQIYLYFATGFDKPLPDGYMLVGTVESVDDTNGPEKDFAGARVEVGQEIYADLKVSNLIYVKYEKGYAEFKTR